MWIFCSQKIVTLAWSLEMIIATQRSKLKKKLCLTSVDILLSKDCHHGLELRAWSLEKEFTTQSSKLKALSNEETKPLEQDISTMVKQS